MNEILNENNIKSEAQKIGIEQLTDTQIKEIQQITESCINQDIEMVQKSKGEHPEDFELKEGQALVETNPITGEKKFRPTDEAETFKDVTLEELIDDDKKDDSIINQVAENMEISEEDKKMYDLSDEDAAAILSIIQRYKKGEKFSIYGAMPETIQKTVRQLAGTNDMREIGAVAKMFIEQFASNLVFDKEYIDFQNAITNEIDKINIVNIYGDQLKEKMTVGITADAEKLREKYPDKADKFLEIKDAFISAYTYDKQKEALKNNNKVARRLDKDIKHFSRMCTSFNYKYKDSKFVIKDISLAGQVLSKILPFEYTAEQIQKFFILFMRITLNMHPSDIVEHTYMYYTLLLITDLEFMTDSSEFKKEILDNIKEVLDMIK